MGYPSQAGHIMNIREVYQILRDRFQGKSRYLAIFDVKLNQDDSVTLTSTIIGSNYSFLVFFKSHQELISEINEMFRTITESYFEKGFTVRLAVPTPELMQSFDDLLSVNNYRSYFKSTTITTQLTISKSNGVK